MRIVLQRVLEAAVQVSSRVVGEIGPGFLLLVGVEEGDGTAAIETARAKIGGLRVFPDAEGRMNVAADEAGAELLVVSQFTLAGDLSRGRRPSFVGAARPETAEPLVEQLARGLEVDGFRVAEGIFGADMRVSLVNWGPVTLILEIDASGRVRRPPRRS